jgi:hypothetical protein
MMALLTFLLEDRRDVFGKRNRVGGERRIRNQQAYANGKDGKAELGIHDSPSVQKTL